MCDSVKSVQFAGSALTRSVNCGIIARNFIRKSLDGNEYARSMLAANPGMVRAGTVQQAEYPSGAAI